MRNKTRSGFSDGGGDRTRLAALYTAYRGLMFHAANQILNHPQDAEDAVQQAFLALAGRSLPEPGPGAKVLSVTVVRHKAIDLYRARRRHPAEELEEDIPGDNAPPSDGTLAGAMAALPSAYREVLLLKYYNGYSTAEIAELLDTTPENVRQRISRAKGKLAAELTERGEAV